MNFFKKYSGVIATLALIVALGVAIYIGGSISSAIHSLSATSALQPLGSKDGDTNITNLVLSGDLETASSTVKNQATLASSTEKYVGGAFAAGATYGFWLNDTGRTAYADMGVMGFTGTASSSFRMIMFSTTTNPASFAASQPFTAATAAGADLVGATTYATSTTATTTNSMTTRALGVAPIANGSYLVTYLQRGDANCVNLPANNGCEAATSTTRGITPSWTAHLFW